MTHKTFWDNPYAASHTALVTKVKGTTIFLDSTIFFAFSGGQESDQGFIGDLPVIQAETLDRDIAYTLPEHHGLSVGDSVGVRINWERRYRLMRLHFAAELVLEVVYRVFPGIQKIGAHIAEQKARLDFSLGESITPYLSKITESVMDLIQSDSPIISSFAEEGTERRYWEIEGFARVPCGGTHLKRTGEIGSIRLKRNNIGKDKERIEIILENQFLTCKE